MTDEQLSALCERVRVCVHNVWQAIGVETVHAYQDCDEALPDSPALIEICLDANRMASYGGEHGAEVDREYEALEWKDKCAIFDALCRSMNLGY